MMSDVQIRQITREDDEDVREIIQSVGKEFGAIGEGFGPSDPEVSAMSQFYKAENRSGYWVAEYQGKIIGCGGIATFDESKNICELRKLFLLPETRGKGIGKALMTSCLSFARQQGFQQCYLDTLKTMTSAIAMYERFGFKHLDAPLGGTIHGGCDVWMLLDLNE